MSNHPPLWLPEGSGRLLLALGVVGTICYLSVAGLVWGLDVPVSHPLVSWLLNSGSMILGFYFGVRSQQKKNGTPPGTGTP